MKIHGTAKGGALSTKDFGVAFSAGAAGLENLYESNNYPAVDYNMRMIYGETDRFAGSRIGTGTATGLDIYQIVAWFKQRGDCSGLTLYAQVRNTTSGITIKAEMGNVDAGAISASYEAITFPQQTSGYTTVENDVIGYYLNGGDATNDISIGGDIFGSGDANTNYAESNNGAWDSAGGTNAQQPALQIWGLS